MSVRNIDKGYIGADSGTINTSGYVTLPLTFTGVVMTVNGVFNSHDGIVTLTLPPIYGAVSTGAVGIQCLLPPQYSGKTGMQASQFVNVTSYDSTGSILGTYSGAIYILGDTLEILTTGQYVAGTTPQGLPNSTTVVYLTDI